MLVGFRHALQASELCELQWTDVEFETATLHIRRAEGGTTSTQPLLIDEMRALRALKREAKSAFIFVSERGAPFTVAGFAKLVERASIAAIRICRGMQAGFAWRTRRPIRARCKATSGTEHPIDRALHRSRAQPL